MNKLFYFLIVISICIASAGWSQAEPVVTIKLNQDSDPPGKGWKFDDPNADIINELEDDDIGAIGEGTRKKKLGPDMSGMETPEIENWMDKENKDLRYPPTYRIPPKTEGDEPPFKEALKRRTVYIDIDKFWKGDTPTPDRQMIIEIRYKDTQKAQCSCYAYNGRTFKSRSGLRSLGYFGGINDGRWKTVYFITSFYDFRVLKDNPEKTRFAIRTTSAGLPIAHFKIHERTDKLEAEARKQYRNSAYIHNDCKRRRFPFSSREIQRGKSIFQKLGNYPEMFDKYGYIFFRRPIQQDVMYYEVPRKHEMFEKPSVSMFLSQSEFYSASFSVYTLKDVKNLRYDFTGPLKMDDGTPFKGFLKPWHLEYMTYPPTIRKEKPDRAKHFYSTQSNRMWPLKRLDYLDLKKGVSKRFWLTGEAYEGCKPGIYKTQIKITADDCPDLLVDVEIEVLPIDLPTFEELGFEAGWWFTKAWPSLSEYEYWELARHNYNNMHCFASASGSHGVSTSLRPDRISINYGSLDNKMQFAKKCGFTGPVIIELGNLRKVFSKGYPDTIHAGDFEDWKNLYGIGCYLMHHHARKYGWPVLGFCPGDEPWGFSMWHKNDVARRWVHQFDENIPMYFNFYGGHHTHVAENFNIINTNAYRGDPCCTYECDQYNISLWCYGRSTNDSGFQPWAYAMDGVIDCAYGGDQGWVPSTSHDSEGKVAFVGGTILTTNNYERRAASLFNTRYGFMAENLAKKKNPEIYKKLTKLKYDLKAFYYGPGYSGANIHKFRRDVGKGFTGDVKKYDKKRKALMAKCQHFLKSWKGKLEAGKGVQNEYNVLKSNLGTPPPSIENFANIRRQLSDWILEMQK